jgi:hypothetical protein
VWADSDFRAALGSVRKRCEWVCDKDFEALGSQCWQDSRHYWLCVPVFVYIHENLRELRAEVKNVRHLCVLAIVWKPWIPF